MRLAPRCLAAALLASAGGCAAARPDGAVRRDSAGIALVENTVAVWSHGGWRLDVAAARPIELHGADAISEAPAVAVLADGGFAVGADGRIIRFDRHGRRTTVHALPDTVAVGALYARADGSLVAWDADRLAAIDVGADGSPVSARAYEAVLPRGSVRPLGAFSDGSLLVSVRHASMFNVADEAGRDTVPVFRLGPGGAHAAVFTVPGPEELTWRVSSGAIRIPMPFARDVHVAAAGARAWVADAMRAELRGYDAAGRLRTIVRAPIRGDSVDPVHAASWRERLRRYMHGQVPDEVFQRRQASLALPGRWPPFAALLTGPRGELWLRAGSEPGRDARWNVFDGRGTWLGEVQVPARFELGAVGDAYVIATERRSDAGDRLTMVPLAR